MPNQEPAIAWPFGNGPVRVGTQGLFRPCLKTFVAPFNPARLTAPGSPRMVGYVLKCWSCIPGSTANYATGSWAAYENNAETFPPSRQFFLASFALLVPTGRAVHWCRICTLTVTYVLILETHGSILDYHNPRLELFVLWEAKIQF